ncbi:hypothetical protein [Vitiosangium sp. GDMCC 1.1324]|uniref:hypothetical protein n=1 Tax=Vitiosangium sp. (strain GDMCC 1.1324) TaxID=2138576 RepID=UPI000D35CC31|nr:hypothetical protein [Vitiosangium sp. GDMCC 1.1324]PTL79703.1 hypothetical protein DAT35_33430 [Vitiosangium sp. GDMCC 1.1324]
MPLFLRVLCRSREPVTLGELTTFIRNGWFFDEPVRFESALDEARRTDLDWRSVEIHYQQGRRPVLVEHLFEEARVAEEVAEALEALQRAGLASSHAALVQRIQESRQLFLFEVDPVGAPEECWMMLDATEAFLARTRDGVVFVDEEGFYDAALQPICKLGDR